MENALESAAHLVMPEKFKATNVGLQDGKSNVVSVREPSVVNLEMSAVK